VRARKSGRESLQRQGAGAVEWVWPTTRLFRWKSSCKACLVQVASAPSNSVKSRVAGGGGRGGEGVAGGARRQTRGGDLRVRERHACARRRSNRDTTAARPPSTHFLTAFAIKAGSAVGLTRTSSPTRQDPMPTQAAPAPSHAKALSGEMPPGNTEGGGAGPGPGVMLGAQGREEEGKDGAGVGGRTGREGRKVEGGGGSGREGGRGGGGGGGANRSRLRICVHLTAAAPPPRTAPRP
jgi:hypothetical protein